MAASSSRLVAILSWRRASGGTQSKTNTLKETQSLQECGDSNFRYEGVELTTEYIWSRLTKQNWLLLLHNGTLEGDPHKRRLPIEKGSNTSKYTRFDLAMLFPYPGVLDATRCLVVFDNHDESTEDYAIIMNRTSHSEESKNSKLLPQLPPLAGKSYVKYPRGTFLCVCISHNAGTDNAEKAQSPTEPGTAENSNFVLVAPSRATRQSETPSPGSGTANCDSVPSNRPKEPKRYGPGQLGWQSSTQENALEHGMRQILADWEMCQEDASTDSDSDNDVDISAGSSPVSNASEDSHIECNQGVCFTRHGDAPPSGAQESPGTNGIGSGIGSRISKNDLDERASHSLQAMGNGDSKEFAESLIDNGLAIRKEKANAKTIPCPIEKCRGRDSSVSELLRKLQTAQHGKFICQICWRDLATPKGLKEHAACEKYCVVGRCKPENSQEVRHKYDRRNCAEKCDVGNTLEARKEDEYQYLCGLLGVPSRPLEEGFVTPHKGQRKSPSKKGLVGQRAVNHVVEATRLNKILENENQELRRHNEELVQILQQTLEEYEAMNPRISKALYRRIKLQVPAIVEELPHSIKPFSDAIPLAQDSSSVSSLGQLSGSSSSSHLSDSLKRESRATNGSNDIPAKRPCLAAFSAAGRAEVTTLPTERSRPRSKGSHWHGDEPCLSGPSGHAQSQGPHAPSFAQEMSVHSSSNESDYHRPRKTRVPSPIPPTRQTLSLAHLPTTSYQEHLPGSQARPISPLSRDCEWTFPEFGQDNPAVNFEFDAMDCFNVQDPNYALFTQEFDTWDGHDLVDLLSVGTRGGEGVSNDFLSQVPRRQDPRIEPSEA